MDHTHDMKPDRPVKPTVYQCSSCMFRCTPNTVAEVRRRSNEHRLVKAKDPQAKSIWGK